MGKLRTGDKNFDIIINATSLGLKNGEDFGLICQYQKQSYLY